MFPFWTTVYSTDGAHQNLNSEIMEFETVWPLNVQIGRSKLTLNLYFGIGINDEFRQVEFIPRAIFGATAIDSIKFF